MFIDLKEESGAKRIAVSLKHWVRHAIIYLNIDCVISKESKMEIHSMNYSHCIAQQKIVKELKKVATQKFKV